MNTSHRPFAPSGEDGLSFVLSNFASLEQALIGCMDYIPFIEQNKSTVSPKFIPIILEGCSLIDSVFRYTAGGEKLPFRRLSRILERRLSLEEATTFFLADRLQLLRPFAGWTTSPPDWWIVYNSLKHDRVRHYASATFLHAVNTLAGLHQVLARSNVFLEQITKAGWIPESDPQLAELLTMRYVGCANPPPIAAQVLFSSVR